MIRIGDPWFRGIDLRTGADGSVFISDWSDLGECHESDGVHRHSGRIYQVAYGRPRAPLYDDLSLLSNSELVGLLTHENVWYPRQAQRVLQDRFAAGQDMQKTHRQLLALYDTSNKVTDRLHALWTLHATEGDDTTWVRHQLNDANEHIRTWAARLVVEPRHYSPGVGRQLTELIAHEPSGLVLLFVASDLQRIPADDLWPLAMELGKRDEWANDPALPRMI